MSELHCFVTIFLYHLNFNIGALKLRDLAKLWIFQLIMKKSNFKEISYDVIIITSPKNVTKLTSQKFSILGYPNQNFWLRQ